VKLEESFIQTISMKIHDSRPNHRKHKSIDINQTHALLSWDYTVFSKSLDHSQSQSQLAIEIKPKSSILIKDGLCRFCSLQRIKQKNCIYCPLDLFSKDPERIDLALWNMIQDSHVFGGNSPYIRLFQDGKEINDDNRNQFMMFLNEFFNNQCNLQDLIDLIREILLKDEILSLLEYNQRKYHFNPLELNSQDSETLKKFLLGMTLKDCSFIIRLTKLPHEKAKLFSNKFWYDIKLIDIDAKPLNKIEEEIGKWKKVIKLNLNGCHERLIERKTFQKQFITNQTSSSS
jgi:hypothetical protein